MMKMTFLLRPLLRLLPGSHLRVTYLHTNNSVLILYWLVSMTYSIIFCNFMSNAINENITFTKHDLLPVRDDPNHQVKPLKGNGRSYR